MTVLPGASSADEGCCRQRNNNDRESGFTLAAVLTASAPYG
jgi:hypothetical protein